MTSVFEQGDQGAASSLLFVSYYCQPFTGTQRTESYISNARNVSTLTNLIVASIYLLGLFGQFWTLLAYIYLYGMILFDFIAQLKFLLAKIFFTKHILLHPTDRM